MHAACFAVITLAVAALYAGAAVVNFTHNKSVAEIPVRIGVSTSWMVRLGLPLGAGSSIGLALFRSPHPGAAEAGRQVSSCPGVLGVCTLPTSP